MPPPCRHDPPDLPPPGEPYAAPRCRLCWLYLKDPAYRELWDNMPVVSVSTTTPRPEPLEAVPEKDWPWTAWAVARLRHPDDTGLGDTIARNLFRFGADAFKRLFKRIVGKDCGCDRRREKLNQLYRYAR